MKHPGGISAVLGLVLLLSSSGPLRADDRAPETEAERLCAEYAARAQADVDEGEIAPTVEARLAAYKSARALGRRALELDDHNADALFVVFAAEGRITLLEGGGSLPNPYSLYKAQGQLDHVLELDPNHPNALAAKGGLYRQLPWALGGDLEKAEIFLKRAIDSNPKAIGARLELAQTYRDMGQPEKCEPLIEAAARLAKELGKQHQYEEATRLKAEILESKTNAHM